MKYILFLFSMVCFSQEYHIDSHDINALKVYEVRTREQADILVYFVNNKNQILKKGCWFVDRKTPTSKPIRYVNFPQQADIKIYRVRTREQLEN
ncbi:MAG: DUF6150 family protein [Flavobacterium circumlabens]|uniref:DUF6150 family protein n=1 Tax=Flavobacterium circumlabens TaxID=2133765 RepID=UPI0032645DD1